MINRLWALAAASLLALPPAARAWGDEGHGVVGLVAARFLDATVRSRIDALLSGDASGLVASTDIPSEATWADKYRDSDRNSTKVRYNQTHLWHFVDIELAGPDLDAACNQHPSVPAGTPASAADPNDCIVDKIEQFAAELARPGTSPEERRLALQFLLHFVGDVHQPLHAADDHDQGGNAKKVHGAGTSGNLHSSWDTPFVAALGASENEIADVLVAAIAAEKVTQWSEGSAADWARESFEVARSQVYGKLPAPTADGSYTLDSAYVENAKRVVAEQLSKAGVRLAWLLNRSLAGPVPQPRELLADGGFEAGAASSPWNASRGVLSDDGIEPPHAGSWVAWLNGWGRTTTDHLEQAVALPAEMTSATLSFWIHIDTDETTTKVRDRLSVQLLDASGRVLKTLATFSNLDAAEGYRQFSFDLSTFKGQRVKLRFTGREDGARQTSFVLDDASLVVQ